MISIITAGYSTKYIDLTWESIKKQTFKQWEWGLICDNSDEVRSWYNNKKENGEFDGYDVWFVDVGRSQGRYGLPCRNAGVMLSNPKYKYWAWLDDDVSFQENEYLEKMVKISEKNDKIAFSNLHLLGKKPDSTYDRYKTTRPFRNFIDCGNPLYKKEFILKYGLLDDSLRDICFDADYIDKIRDGEGGEDAFVKVKVNILFRHKRY